MKKNNKKPKNSISQNLGEKNLSIRASIINSSNLSEEIFFKKYFCDRETLFIICLSSFLKLDREKIDIKFISLYLSNLKKFTGLLKNSNEDNYNSSLKKNNEENNKYLKTLKYVSEHIICEKYSAKKLLMKYGDKGDKFYLILHGTVSILIPIKVNIQLTFNEYNRYIAILIFYKEFELARMSIKDNKHIYNIDLPDIKVIIQYINKNKEDSLLNDENNNKKNSFILAKNLKNKPKLERKMTKKFFAKVKEENNNNIHKDLELEKMIEIENSTKIEKFMKKYLTKEEFILFQEMKIKDNDDKIITPEKYINRLKNYKFNYNYFIRRKSSKMLDFSSHETYNNYENMQSSNHKSTVYIYEYQEITHLETGEMFGDSVMNGNSNKRTATIISIEESYFGCLEKEIYTAIKGSNDKTRKNNVNYLCHTTIFKSINYRTLEDRYFNFFAFKDSIKDEIIIHKDEINTNLFIIKNGTFEINFNGKLKDIFNLMNYYRDTFCDIDEKKYEMNESLFKKIYKLNENIRKIEKLFGKNKDINKEHKLFIINNSGIFGLRETEKKEENENFLSFFDIKCISSEGEYILLDKKIFYRQIYATDYKVKEETKYYLKEFAEKTINRLIHLLYAKIWKILTRNNMEIFRNIKLLSYMGEENKTISNNLIDEVGLDFKYMDKYDLTDIECIIDKIISKYNENEFDNNILDVDLYTYFENKKISTVRKKNLIKLEEQKYEKNKFNNLIKQMKTKDKKHYTRLINFKRHNSIVSRRNSLVFKNSKVPQLMNNNNVLVKNSNNLFTPKKNKYSLDKNTSFFLDEKKNNFNMKGRNRKNIVNIFNKKNRLYSAYNKLSKNFTLAFSQGNSKDSFCSDVNVNCDYSSFNNACISKLNYNIKKNNSSIDNELLNNNWNEGRKLRYNSNLIEYKMNQIFGGNERYKSKFNRCFSARFSNHSSINIFDSNQTSKELYVDKRKEYVLKNTRSFFTRNKNCVLYKRRRRTEDKKV